MNRQQLGFVLHRRPYRETSLILTLLTSDYGRVNANVRGVRSGKMAMQKQAWLQPFQPLLWHWTAKSSASHDWVYPKSYEPQGAPIMLSGDGKLCGLYMNELLYRLLPESMAVNELFKHYYATLEALSHVSERDHQAWYLRLFEFNLLTELGYEISLTQDLDHQAIDAAYDYRYLAEQGWQRLNTRTATGRADISGYCLLKLAQQEYCPQCSQAWKRLMRSLLQPHLGAKPLATRQLFQS